MSKSQRKNRSELEHLKGQIRELEKENRALKRQLKSLEKKEHIFDETMDGQDEEIISDSEDTFPILKYRIPCGGDDGCGKGFFAEYSIMDKVIGTCSVCGRRERLK